MITLRSSPQLAQRFEPSLGNHLRPQRVVVGAAVLVQNSNSCSRPPEPLSHSPANWAARRSAGYAALYLGVIHRRHGTNRYRRACRSCCRTGVELPSRRACSSLGKGVCRRPPSLEDVLCIHQQLTLGGAARTQCQLPQNGARRVGGRMRPPTPGVPSAACKDGIRRGRSQLGSSQWVSCNVCFSQPSGCCLSTRFSEPLGLFQTVTNAFNLMGMRAVWAIVSSVAEK